MMPVAARKLFQAVRCGSLNVAFPYGWASMIVDDFELAPVPRAPAWLVGAVNIEGTIVPVVDLGRYRRNDASIRSESTSQAPAKKRLLVGSVQPNQSDQRIAIAFDGLPQQLEAFDSESDGVAESKPGLISGFIAAPAGERFARVNVTRLMDELIDALEAT